MGQWQVGILQITIFRQVGKYIMTGWQKCFGALATRHYSYC